MMAVRIGSAIGWLGLLMVMIFWPDFPAMRFFAIYASFCMFIVTLARIADARTKAESPWGEE